MGFFCPSPLVHKFTQPPLLRLLTMSAFEGTPLQCGRPKCKPPKDKDSRSVSGALFQHNNAPRESEVALLALLLLPAAAIGRLRSAASRIWRRAREATNICSVSSLLTFSCLASLTLSRRSVCLQGVRISLVVGDLPSGPECP